MAPTTTTTEMQQLTDGSLVLAATDLTSHLGCPHLTQQRIAIARGERGRPRPADDPHAELVRTRGERHEREQLERLAAELGGYVDLSGHRGGGVDAIEAGVAATLDAMREGAPLIFQAQFFDGRWQGRADFLRRIDEPSDLGDWSYEVIDTKLARHVKPQTVHQLSLYSRILGDAQRRAPDYAYVILGDGTEERIELARYAALHRHVSRRLEQLVDGPPQDTYPEPVEHCQVCALAAECHQRRVDDDHLSLVAGARREYRERLVEVGLPTVAELADPPQDFVVNGFGAERFDLLRNQAALQVRSRESGEPCHRHLEPERAAGYAALPEPSDGDVFFDLEGDPYIGDAGIEYLWGWWTAEDYECLWAHDTAAEKAAFEQFIDRVLELRERFPDLHVYHYAPHERSKLRSLSIAYATREEEIDLLLRAEVLVDLYGVVRRALQVGEDSYSLKRLECHHGFVRTELSVREGGGSIVAYEDWLESGDGELLDAIRAYNEDDCKSTASLRDWLLDAMRPEAAVEFGINFEELHDPEPGHDHPEPAWLPDVLELIDGLTDGVAADGTDDSPEEAERRLLGHLLLYHRREGKPEWWRYFDLESYPLAELIHERDVVAGLERDQGVPPVPQKRSLDYAFTFPPQEFKLDLGDKRDPTTKRTYNVVGVNETHVVIRRGATADPPAPAALGPGSPIDPAALRNALVELAGSVLADDGRFPAVRALLRGQPPTLDPADLSEDTETLMASVTRLGETILPIQGPPGTGKTHRGARMALAALRAGKRVGITAQSHTAIHNLLRELERIASAEEFEFTGICKGAYTSVHGLIESTAKNDAHEDYALVAGTAWLFARPEHRDAYDVLIIDEAGQFSLANAAAAGLAARGLVLLGDPQQLPQVNKADHPEGSGASVLEHVLDGASTISEGRGVLLTESWRMHPSVCEFVSDRSYDGRLHSRDPCVGRRIDVTVGSLTGTGLRTIPVDHAGRSQASPEEAEAIAAACRDLLTGSAVTDAEGKTRDLVPEDILVVAPYNLAVRTIDAAVPDRVRVGTVDRFQGQEAPVVFYALTCSAGEDVPRGLDFLFDDHRLNVAVSRAQCLAVVVYSRQLLDAECPTLEGMRLLDGICGFVEASTEVSLASSSCPNARSRTVGSDPLVRENP